MSAGIEPPSEPMTVAAFLAWDSGDTSGRLWQLRDGVPEAMAPASRTHGALQSELGRLIGNHLLDRAIGCTVVTAPGVVPNVRAADNVRVPDLAVTCAPPDGTYLLADPVLLVEILSPSNTAETWANVWSYISIPSVTEILLVSSTAVTGELLRRDAAGGWPKQPLRLDRASALVLDSIGLRVPFAALYRTTALA